MGLKSCSEAGFLSRLFFWWLNDLLFLGYKRELKSNDLRDQLLQKDSSYKLSSKLFKLWDKETLRKTPSLFRAIRKQFGFDYLILGFLPFVEECGIRIIQPILLGFMIDKLKASTPPYLEAALIILCSIFNVFTTHWFYFSVQHVGMRVRVACSCLIYRKCLRQLQSPEGKLLNLLSTDVQRFDQSSVYLHYLWIGPVNLILVFSILYQYYGTASFIGFVFLVIFTVLQAFLGVGFSKLRTQTAQRTDLRMGFMNSMLKKMKQIKMLGLEEFYQKSCAILRENEISFIRKAAYLRAINLTFFYSSIKIIFFLTIWWYGSIDTETVFVTLSLFHNVRNLMMNNFPNGVLQVAEAKVAITRIQNYLLEKEDGQSCPDLKSKTSPSITLSNIRLKCRRDKINMEIKEGEIVSIIGSVGTGKTTLLKAILGEIKLPEGSASVRGSVAYVPQTPWIYPGSMVDNIILNSPYEAAWFEAVTQACALKDYGHISLESLSGGMRARIALARAAYSKADIYLLDDVFAALDGQTKAHIMDELVQKLLAGKIRIICGGDATLGTVLSLDGFTYDTRRRSMAISNTVAAAVTKKIECNDEEMKSGSVHWKTYFNYFRSGCGIFGFILLIMVNVICQVSFSGADYYLKIWKPGDGMAIYGSIIGVLCLTSLFRTVMFFRACLKSSVVIHDKVFSTVSTAHQEFFVSYGKILNRFGKDMSLMDESLPTTFFSAFSVLLHVLGTIIVIAIVNPLLLIPAVILTLIFYSLRRFYIRTGRAVRRIEALVRTPLYTLISSTASGLSTIRCFNAEEKFLNEFNYRLDNHSCSWYINLATSRWFGIWLDWISVFYTAVVVGSFVISNHTGLDVGLAISSVLFLSGTFQLGARQSADVENQMVSVERILEYASIPVEDFDSGDSGVKISAPIEFENVSVTYNDMEVLKNVSFKVHKGEKIALLGKTGCGKTTLLKALYRLADYTGSIKFGGIDSKAIKLQELRASLSIIPQEPYLFHGTIRENLDPHGVLPDNEIYRVFNKFGSFFEGIEAMVEEDGLNLSQGQRQILSLIRVILKGNEILIMDEPTANLDSQTDDLIKESLEEFCSSCTVITVAHRLQTIAHYDRAFLIEDGKLRETSVPSFEKIAQEVTLQDTLS